MLALGGLLWYLLPDGRQTVETTRTSDPKGIYLTSAPDNWVSIGATPNEFVNRDIHNRAGEKLGTIKDVLVGPDGRMTAVILNVGRELGLGDKDVAIPFTALQLEQGDTGRRIVIDAVKETLQTAPTFERRQLPKKHSSWHLPRWRRRIGRRHGGPRGNHALQIDQGGADIPYGPHRLLRVRGDDIRRGMMSRGAPTSVPVGRREQGN